MWFYRITATEWKWPFVVPEIIIGEWLPIQHNKFEYPSNRIYRIEFKDDQLPYLEPDTVTAEKEMQKRLINSLYTSTKPIDIRPRHDIYEDDETYVVIKRE